MVAVKLSQEAEILEYKEKSSLSFIKFFFCRFTFKRINHEVDNLVSASKKKYPEFCHVSSK